MAFLVFALSGILVLAGAISLVSGLPSIQMERGWAEVIAGSVALSAGVVTFAIGAVLLRLASIQAMLGSRGFEPLLSEVERPAPSSQDDGVAAPTVPRVASLDPAPLADRTEPPSRTEAPAEEAVSSQPPARHGLWKRFRPAGETAPDRPTELPAAIVAPTLAVAAEPQDSQPRFGDLVSALAVEPPERSAPLLDPVGTFSPEPDPPVVETRPAPEPQRAAPFTWLDKALAKPRTPPPPSRLPEPAFDPRPALPDPVEAQMPARDVAETEPDPDYADPHPGSAPEPNHPEAETPEEVTVIGRYQAGVASYVMYSDGTIEVETEAGVQHRFASMEELKDFIARHDSPVG